ncbi:MAG: thiamine diphosphokinase [Patescibacteria group bacterium]|nr:thiamine diphosphokinase [Patescibacteria group bacterium]
MVKRAVLFVNGDLAKLPRLKLRQTDFLIGVDGGTRLIRRLGLKANIIIGDFDSFPRPPSGAMVIKSSQDLTDTELALDYCVKKGFKEIILVGILGRRLDHLLTNIFLGSRFNLTIIEGRQTLYFVRDKLVLHGHPGDLVSLIPLLGNCHGVITTGLKWRLQGETLKAGYGRGVSNVMTGKTARVYLKKGRLLVVYNCL